MVILDTFYWYTFNDYTNLAISFNAITPPTGLTWLLLSYLAMSFALFAQNLHMRAFLTVIALVTGVFVLVWIVDIWRTNEKVFVTFLKNVFVKTRDAPCIGAFDTVALVPLMLSLVIQKRSVANLLIGLVNFLKATAKKIYMIVFYLIFATSRIGATYAMNISLYDKCDAVRSDKPSGFSATLVWLSILGVIQIALKLLNLDLALLAALWAWITWQGNIKTILGRMKDFKLGEYLTRKVTSYLYNFYFVVIIGFAAIAILIYASSTYGINQDYAAFPIVAAGGVVITFLVILGIRLVFKPAVAIVHIAENAKKSFE
jgi:hypothetical protein